MGKAESRWLSLVGWSHCLLRAVTAGWQSLAWLEEKGHVQIKAGYQTRFNCCSVIKVECEREKLQNPVTVYNIILKMSEMK